MEQLGSFAVHAVRQLMQLLCVLAVVVGHIAQQRQRLLGGVAVVGVLVIVMVQTFHGGTSRIFENIVPRRQGKVNFTGKIVKKSTITDK